MASAAERLCEWLFEERTDGARPRVEAGAWIKAGLRGERFWGRVRRVRADGALVVTVENNLLRSAHRCGDEIVLQSRHVLEIATGMDRLTFQSLAVTNGPEAGALAWRRAADGAAEGETDQTYTCWPV